MTPERWSRVKELFERAARLPPGERATVLAEACAGDDALRHEVESLVDAHLQSGDFLETPAAPASAVFGLEGRRFGPYELGPRIGAGGMGDVYRARDTRLNRTVAIKVCAARSAPGDAASRLFAREAKAVSALGHPHICRLHDVGQWGTIDYLVMEYVEGEPIDAYCRRHALGLRQRLAMFRTVCDAVHYAHQNLVVHRDLKPANILVGVDGQPKLLDFGIAKLLAGSEGEDAAATLAPALTPEYASPEQVRGEPVTTATDVYSLGVVIYELLVGRRPWAHPTRSLEQIVQQACTTEPDAPSVAASAAPQGSPALVRASELRGDLDTIVLKALRKEPERRYRSAQELSDDVGRFLAGRPVLARGDSITYKVAKFVARHRTAAAAAVLVVASLVAAMALIVRQSRIAEVQRQRAEHRFADVRKLAGSFLFEFHDAIQYLPGATRARQLVVARGLEYLDSLAAESADDPTLRAELARAYHRIGEVLGDTREANLGDAAGALASYRKALALQEPLARARPHDGAAQYDMARTLRAIGDVQVLMREASSALVTFRRAIAAIEPMAAAPDAERHLRRELAHGHARVAGVMTQLEDRAAAGSAYQRAIALLEPLARDAADVESRRALARSYKGAGALRILDGDVTGGLALGREALRLNEALAAAEPLNVTFRNEVAMSHNELGLAYLRTGDPAAALESLRLAEAITAAMVRDDASNAQVRWLHGLELNSIGVTLLQMGRHAEAIASHMKALALLEGVARRDAPNETYQYNVANTAQLIADAHVEVARASTSAAGRVQAWTTARAWYQRSARGFDGMRRRGALSGALAGDRDADLVEAGLALCERELQAAQGGRPAGR